MKRRLVILGVVTAAEAVALAAGFVYVARRIDAAAGYRDTEAP